MCKYSAELLKLQRTTETIISYSLTQISSDRSRIFFVWQPDRHRTGALSQGSVFELLPDSQPLQYMKLFATALALET